MTLVARGPPRRQRELEAVLETHERPISFQVSPFDEGEPRPYVAAARKLHARRSAPMPSRRLCPLHAALAGAAAANARW